VRALPVYMRGHDMEYVPKSESAAAVRRVRVTE
jgi:hypothetical protein